MKGEFVGHRFNRYARVGFRKYDSIQEKYEECIDNSKLTESSKAILWEWADDRRGNKFRDKNNIGLIGTIRNISEMMNKDLLEITKKDLQSFFSNSKFSSSTELWYKKALKRFYKWLSSNKDEKYLLVVSWIDTVNLSSKCSLRARKKREDNLLSPKEVRKLIASAYSLRDKLAISLLADTGIRAESIGANENNRSIDIGQVSFYKGYAIIKDIEEKFDKRRDVIVTESLSYLIKYWNEYPEDKKNDPKSPLFFALSSNRKLKRWGYSGLKMTLNKLSEKAIGRRINPHDFRHLKGTRLHLDEQLSDDAKCKLMGWSSRRMLDRYNHTTFDDAKKEYLEKKGIIKIDKKKAKVEASILRPKECLVCHHINSDSDSICENCGNTLDYESIIKAHAERQKAEDDLGHFIKPGEIQKLFKLVHKLKRQIEKK